LNTAAPGAIGHATDAAVTDDDATTAQASASCATSPRANCQKAPEKAAPGSAQSSVR
jgi:hypothetical protein